MSKLILCYSLSGHSAKHARDFAAANGGELVEVKTAKKLGKLKSFLLGCPKAIAGKPMAIMPLNLPDCDGADVFAPIWAGCIAPPMLAAFAHVKKGTRVNLHMVSASGNSSKAKNTAAVQALGLEVIGYEDLK